MANALHIPQESAGGERPVAPVRMGFAALAERLSKAQGNSDPALAARVVELRAALDAANTLTRQFEHEGKWQESMKSNQEAQRLAGELNALLVLQDRFTLRIANALWVQRTYPLSPDFVALIDRFYGSGAATALDIGGDPEGSRRRINEWVEERTERRIRDLIPDGALAPVIRLVITNAIYFKGEWTIPFDERNTRPEPFHGGDGRTADAMMMRDAWRNGGSYAAFTGTGEYFDTPSMVPADEASRPPTYPDDAGFQVLQLPYKGGDVAMVFLLPRSEQGLAALESKLDAATLDGWMAKLAARTVDTTIPRFKLEWDGEMSGPLQRLGMVRAFVRPDLPGGAQFGGMTTSHLITDQLYIATVFHKAWIEVAEKGTEAAAATAVLMAPGRAIEQPPPMVPFTPQFRADRPFLFLIRDTATGAILFMGRMKNPG